MVSFLDFVQVGHVHEAEFGGQQGFILRLDPDDLLLVFAVLGRDGQIEMEVVDVGLHV